MQQPQIFISYRRDDAAGYARAVNDELVRSFGAGRVFIDVDDIQAGLPFSEIIQRSVGSSAVLLALIGKRWRGERDDAAPRIFEPGDFVRQEVAAALAKGLRVIPLLLDGAAIPDAAQLPPELRPLAGRNALELDHTRFEADMARLVRELRAALGEAAAAPPSTRERPRAGWWFAAALVAAAAVGALWQAQRTPAPRSASPGEQAGAPMTRAPVNGEWQADVTYDWENARFTERFSFGGENGELHGSASFLGVPRGVLEGRVDAGSLGFVLRTRESTGAAVVHRYRARLSGDELRFVMQTEGSSSAHVPIEFAARRVTPAASQAGR